MMPVSASVFAESFHKLSLERRDLTAKGLLLFVVEAESSECWNGFAASHHLGDLTFNHELKLGLFR